MAFQITVHKGRPTPEEWGKIGEMIQSGASAGVNKPPGIIWDLGWMKPGPKRPSQKTSEK